MEKEMIETLISDWELHKQRLEKELSYWQFSDSIKKKLLLTQKLIYIEFFIQDLKDVWEVLG